MLRFTKTLSHGLAAGSRHRSGFTLIKLLVVVSIIALLVSILLPALSLAKHLAYEAHCAHNLHQINIGLVIYADQYYGRYPLEDTEHNPHPDLITILAADSPGLIDVFYCPQAPYMETFAQDTVNYIPKGAADSVIDTPDNRAAGNVSYVYWSFRKNKGIDEPTGPWRNPAYFIPRQLTTTGVIDLDPGRSSPTAGPSERWVVSDFFRRKAPFPHARKHARGLNVSMLDGHVELITGRPRDNYR